MTTINKLPQLSSTATDVLIPVVDRADNRTKQMTLSQLTTLAKGDTGLTGPRGLDGITGIRGPQGPSGAASTVSGPQGPQGSQGPSGPSGAASTVSGPQGPSGPAGAQGPQGPQGTASTVSGPSGPSGVRGPQGPQGAASTVSGPSGPSGVQGPQGAASTVSGPSGPSGPSGVQGPASTVSGPQGSQGPQGPSGVQGPQGSAGVAGSRNYTVTNSGASDYVIDGSNDPSITLLRGFTYTFTVSASGHPFWIKTAQVFGTGSTYDTGVTNNGTDNGTITFAVPYNAPSTLYYICQYHAGMSGTINITDVGPSGASGPSGPAGFTTTSTLVNGTATVSLSAGGNLTFPDSTVQTTAWTGAFPAPANGDSTSGNAWMIFYADGALQSTSKVTINPAAGMLTLSGTSGAGGITFPNSTVQTTAYKSTSSSWTLATGSNTVSITVPLNGNYQMWVNGNIPNGIVEWNATVNVSNPNVPAIGSQYAWYYMTGNALVLDSIPDQIIGTVGVISTSSAYVGNTANVFTFGITNNSISSQVITWGYTTL